jgi:hypothetical protein
VSLRNVRDALGRDFSGEGIFDSLLSSIGDRINTSEGLSLFLFVQRLLVDNAKRITFNDHPDLIELYQKLSPYVVIQKATQRGCTIYAMARAVYDCIHRGLNAGYFAPTFWASVEFSKSRLKPFIELNSDIGRYVAQTDAAGVKEFRGNGKRSHMFIRNMRAGVSAKSIPLDSVYLDEVDEAEDPDRVIKQIVERMSHSAFKEFTALSNPSLPDYGISALFNETDQRHYLLKCEACGHWADLVEEFPECLREEGSQVLRVCVKCGAALNLLAPGEWVPKKPEVTDKRGYLVSQLHSFYVSPAEILKEYRTTSQMGEFYNLKLGLPWISVEDRLTIEQVLACCGTEGMSGDDQGPSFAGVDVGPHVLHVVIAKREWNRLGRVVFVGEVPDFKELETVFKRFGVSRAVIDAMPETRLARDFAEAHGRRVFLCYYSEGQKEGPKWDEATLTLRVNRTESMDSTSQVIRDGQVILPRESDVIRAFALHCHSVGRKLETDEETGSRKYRYIRLGAADHYFHALNYCLLSLRYVLDSAFGDTVLV